MKKEILISGCKKCPFKTIFQKCKLTLGKIDDRKSYVLENCPLMFTETIKHKKQNVRLHFYAKSAVLDDIIKKCESEMGI